MINIILLTVIILVIIIVYYIRAIAQTWSQQMLSYFHQPITVHRTQIAIANDKPKPTTSLIIRPTSKERKYAASHLAAFEKTRATDGLHFCFFKASLACQHNQSSKSWEMAKKWWQELYGDCINENMDDNQQADLVTTTTLTNWVIRELNSQHLTDTLTQESRKFILNSHQKVTQTNDIDVYKEEKRKIRQHILKTHPDKNGNSAETAILIEWKSLIDKYETYFIHNSKMPYRGPEHLTNPSAKPWIVYRLFLENQTAIEQQIIMNDAKSIKKSNMSTQHIIDTNHQIIHYQAMTIRWLESTITKRYTHMESKKMTNDPMPLNHHLDNRKFKNNSNNIQMMRR